MGVQPQMRAKMGSISARLQLRNEKKCFEFKWYMDHIYPEQEIPRQRVSRVQYALQPLLLPDTLALGRLAVANLPICLMSQGDYSSSVLWAAAYDIDDELPPNERWWYSSEGEIRYGSNLCLSGLPRLNSSPSLTQCNGRRGTQRWAFIDNNKQESTTQSGYLYNVASGLCLSVNRSGEDKYRVTLCLCRSPRIQMFYFATNLH